MVTIRQSTVRLSFISLTLSEVEDPFVALRM